MFESIPNGIAATMKTTRSYHAYIAHSITNLADELPELVKVALSLWCDSKFSYATIEFFCSIKRILVVILVLDLPEKPNIFNQSGFDMLIIHKLTKYIELLFQKLVREINL